MTDNEPRPSAIPWPPILLAGALIGPIFFAYVFPLPWPGVGDLAALVAGWFLILAGLFFVGWGIWTLNKHETTVMPHKKSERLVTDGPFALRRNPIYLGDVVILLGLAIVTSNLWFVVAAFAFAVLVTWLAILPEERHLEAEFGDDYLKYKERVRRWI